MSIEVSRPKTVSLLGKNLTGNDNHANHAFSGGVWESLTITIAIDFWQRARLSKYVANCLSLRHIALKLFTQLDRYTVVVSAKDSRRWSTAKML